MFKVKRAIPRLAAASLALTGCGDGDGGAGGAGGAGGVGGAPEPIDAAIEQFCMKVVECYEEQTQSSCEANERAFASGFSDNCLPLWTSYLECMSSVSCAQFENKEGFEACVAEVAEEFGEGRFQACYDDPGV